MSVALLSILGALALTVVGLPWNTASRLTTRVEALSDRIDGRLHEIDATIGDLGQRVTRVEDEIRAVGKRLDDHLNVAH